VNRYGLPLVAVDDLGWRSADAARWNMLLPRLAELLRRVLAQGSPHAGNNVVTVRIEDGALIVHYADGVVHVLVPTSDGLATLYVARGTGARPVVSRIEEGESALGALTRLARGAS
jgi:hypothetical protein